MSRHIHVSRKTTYEQYLMTLSHNGQVTNGIRWCLLIFILYPVVARQKLPVYGSAANNITSVVDEDSSESKSDPCLKDPYAHTSFYIKLQKCIIQIPHSVF